MKEQSSERRTRPMGFEDKYEIGDADCGVITYASKWIEAKTMVSTHRKGAHKECPGLYIYDRLAHKGKCQMWDTEGRCLSIRPKN